jgi:hypothetical protein
VKNPGKETIGSLFMGKLQASPAIYPQKKTIEIGHGGLLPEAGLWHKISINPNQSRRAVWPNPAF